MSREEKKTRKPKQKNLPVNAGYIYDKKKLLELVKKNPAIRLNKAQIIILFPNFTSAFIKYRTSNKCKHDVMPHHRTGIKPFFIYNQVLAYEQKLFGGPVDLFSEDEHEKRFQEEQKREKGEKGEKGKIVKIGNT